MPVCFHLGIEGLTKAREGKVSNLVAEIRQVIPPEIFYVLQYQCLYYMTYRISLKVHKVENILLDHKAKGEVGLQVVKA